MKILKDETKNTIHNFDTHKVFKKFMIVSIPNFSSFKFASTNKTFVKELEATDVNQFLVYDEEMDSYIQFQGFNALRFASLDSLPFDFVNNDTMIPLAIINTFREKLNSSIDANNVDVIKLDYLPRIKRNYDVDSSTCEKMDSIPMVKSNSDISQIKILSNLKDRKYSNTRENIIENFKNPLTSFENFIQFTNSDGISQEAISAISITNIIHFVYENIKTMIDSIPMLLMDNIKCVDLITKCYEENILNNIVCTYVSNFDKSNIIYKNDKMSLGSSNLVYEIAIHKNFVNKEKIFSDIIHGVQINDENLSNTEEYTFNNIYDDSQYMEMNNLLTRTDIKTAVMKLLEIRKNESEERFDDELENISISLSNLMIWRIINALPNYSLQEISSKALDRFKLRDDSNILLKESNSDSFDILKKSKKLSNFKEVSDFLDSNNINSPSNEERKIKIERGEIDANLFNQIMQFVQNENERHSD